MKRFIVCGVFLIAAFFVPFRGRVQAEAVEPPLLISAVKVDGGTSVAKPANEFVELYNPTENDVDLSDWQLEYAKPDSILQPQDCQKPSWSEIDPANTRALTLIGTAPANGRVVIALAGMTDDKRGSLRLSHIAENMPVVHDQVGWGSETSQAVCFETQESSMPGNGELIERCVDGTGVFQDSNDNSKDFFVRKLDDNPTVCPDLAEEPNVNTCIGIEINEIFSNPAGTDTNKEFIEVINPTNESISLKGCVLKTGSSSKQFEIPDELLGPGEIKTMYSSETGLTLTNSGGEVILVNSNEEKVTEYPKLGDDQAYALVDDAWHVANTSSPNEKNVLAVDSDENKRGTETSGLAPCPAGKFRNPATNRCKNLAATAALVACKPGQTRNPVTNRCRSVVIATASLVPCKPGQERNPATNRCRSVLAATTTLKPCDPGEERNPDTNRCRKVSTALATTANPEDTQQKESSKMHYAALGLLGAGAISYGAYEYRTDLKNKFTRLKGKIFSSGK